MALTFFGDSNPISGTASTTPEGDGGAGWSGGTILEGDHAFITVSWKRAGATLSTPTDWELIASASVGTGTPGAGDGPIELRVYYRQVPSGGLSLPTLTMGGDSTGRVVQAGLIVYRGDLGASGELAYAVTSGSDTSSDTSWSVTGAADIGITSGDVLLAFGACTVAGSTTFTSPTLGTTGVTYGSTGNPFSSSTTSGDDLRSWASRAIATAGTSSAAPTFTATVGANTTGGGVFLRLREQSPGVSGTAAAPLGGLTAAATGVRNTLGTAVAALGGLTATVAGGRETFGAAAAALGFTATSSAVDVIEGTAAGAFGGLAATASGTATAVFGKTTNGTSNTASSTTKIVASSATPSSDGIVTVGHARVWLDAAGSARTKLLIYADSAGSPGALLATSDEVTVTTTVVDTVHDYAFSGSNQLLVQSGTAYWLALMWEDPGTPSVTYSRDSTADLRVEKTGFTYPTAPNPFGTPAGPFAGPIDAWIEFAHSQTRRFYLTNAAPAFDPDINRGFWNDTTAGLATPHKLGETPEGPSTSTARAETNAASGWFVMLGQWISAPADVAGTISGAEYSIAAAWLESHGDANLNPVVYVWVTTGNTNTSRGEAIGQFVSAREFATGTPTAIGYTENDNTAVSFQPGDRLVLELGYRAGNASATSYTGTLYYGGTGSPDLADGGTDLNRPGWVDLTITQGVTFAELGIEGTAAAALGGLTATAAGVRKVPGIAAASLGGLTAAASGIIETTEKEGTATSALGFAAVADSFKETFGTAAAELGGLTAVFKVRRGTAAAPLGALTATARGNVGTVGGVPFLISDLGVGGRFVVEIAWGADLNANASTWEWFDVTRHVRNDPGISTKLGRDDEASTSQPASCTMVLENEGGEYSLGGRSPNWPNVRRNVPVRVRIDPDDAGEGFRTVFFGFADGFSPAWDDDPRGRIPVAHLSASGTLRRLAQGSSPVMSAYRRKMLATPSVVHYWPMEEGKNATFAPNLRGGPNLLLDAGEPDWDSDDTFDCSASLPNLESGYFDATGLATYTDTGEHQVRFLLFYPDSGIADGTVLCHIHTTGSVKRWDITYEIVNGDEAIGVFRYFDDAATNLEGSNIIGFALDGVPGRLSLDMVQNGDDIDWRLGHKDARNASGAGFADGTVNNETVGRISRIEINPHGNAGQVVIGHVTVQNEQTSLFEATGELRAHVGEWPSSADESVSRMHRLCAENNVKLTRYVDGGASESLSGYETMGPQLVAPLLPLLRECETCDQGQLWDGRDDGLSYTVRRFREGGLLALTIDAAAGELARPFEPIDDDQRNINRVEATMLRAATARFEDTDGPLGTSTIGIYDTSIEVNNQNDEMAVHYASWLVHLGTTEGYRFPSVSVDLRATPHLAPAVLGVVPGHRIDVINLDDTLAGFDVDTVSLIVEGISHEITAATWVVTFQCSPMSPWALGRVAAESGDTSEFVWRLDTHGTTVSVAAAQGATSLVVATTVPLWTGLADNYPMALDVGGVKVIATACTAPNLGSPQTFTVQPLPVARAAGLPVKLWDPRPIGL